MTTHRQMADAVAEVATNTGKPVAEVIAALSPSWNLGPEGQMALVAALATRPAPTEPPDPARTRQPCRQKPRAWPSRRTLRTLPHFALGKKQSKKTRSQQHKCSMRAQLVSTEVATSIRKEITCSTDSRFTQTQQQFHLAPSQPAG